MADWYKDFTGLGHAVISKSRLSNAMGTPLVLVVLVTITCLGVFTVTRFWPVLLIAVLPVIYFLRAFEYIMKNNPNLLRTEEHEERMLQISSGLGESGKNPIDEVKLLAIEPTSDETPGKPKEGK